MLRKIVCIAGFGDNSSMFLRLLQTDLASSTEIIPLDLPGFGVDRLAHATTLDSMADFVGEYVSRNGVQTVIAHSVGSVIASLAAARTDSPIKSIVSLEGNLTPEDAYFSGTAADYDDAENFFSEFLMRLRQLAEGDPILARYASQASKADPTALWELGCDARRYSDNHVPGETLEAAADVLYIYSPANVPDSSLAWLKDRSIRVCELDGASHWATIDAPELVADAVKRHLF